MTERPRQPFPADGAAALRDPLALDPEEILALALSYRAGEGRAGSIGDDDWFRAVGELRARKAAEAQSDVV